MRYTDCLLIIGLLFPPISSHAEETDQSKACGYIYLRNVDPSFESAAQLDYGGYAQFFWAGMGQFNGGRNLSICGCYLNAYTSNLHFNWIDKSGRQNRRLWFSLREVGARDRASARCEPSPSRESMAIDFGNVSFGTSPSTLQTEQIRNLQESAGILLQAPKIFLAQQTTGFDIPAGLFLFSDGRLIQSSDIDSALSDPRRFRDLVGLDEDSSELFDALGDVSFIDVAVPADISVLRALRRGDFLDFESQQIPLARLELFYRSGLAFNSDVEGGPLVLIQDIRLSLSPIGEDISEESLQAIFSTLTLEGFGESDGGTFVEKLPGSTLEGLSLRARLVEPIDSFSSEAQPISFTDSRLILRLDDPEADPVDIEQLNIVRWEQ